MNPTLKTLLAPLAPLIGQNEAQIQSAVRSLIKAVGVAALSSGAAHYATAHGIDLTDTVEAVSGTLVTAFGLWLSKNFHADAPAAATTQTNP